MSHGQNGLHTNSKRRREAVDASERYPDARVGKPGSEKTPLPCATSGQHRYCVICCEPITKESKFKRCSQCKEWSYHNKCTTWFRPLRPSNHTQKSQKEPSVLTVKTDECKRSTRFTCAACCFDMQTTQMHSVEKLIRGKSSLGSIDKIERPCRSMHSLLTSSTMHVYPCVLELLDQGFCVLKKHIPSKKRSTRRHMAAFLAGTPFVLPAHIVVELRDRISDEFKRLCTAFWCQEKVFDLSSGFRNFRERGKLRYEIVPTWLLSHWKTLVEQSSQVREIQDAMDEIAALIFGGRDNVYLVSCGVFLSIPGSENQNFHSDGPHLWSPPLTKTTGDTITPEVFDSTTNQSSERLVRELDVSDCHLLGPHALNFFVALEDINEMNGTEFYVGSHRIHPKRHESQGASSMHAVVSKCPRKVPDVPQGGIYFFDYRVWHRGLANRTLSERPCIYFTYACNWFQDTENFSKQRYRSSLKLT